VVAGLYRIAVDGELALFYPALDFPARTDTSPRQQFLDALAAGRCSFSGG